MLRPVFEPPRSIATVTRTRKPITASINRHSETENQSETAAPHLEEMKATLDLAIRNARLGQGIRPHHAGRVGRRGNARNSNTVADRCARKDAFDRAAQQVTLPINGESRSPNVRSLLRNPRMSRRRIGDGETIGMGLSSRLSEFVRPLTTGLLQATLMLPVFASRRRQHCERLPIDPRLAGRVRQEGSLSKRLGH
jgi:hypothetical protein